MHHARTRFYAVSSMMALTMSPALLRSAFTAFARVTPAWLTTNSMSLAAKPVSSTSSSSADGVDAAAMEGVNAGAEDGLDAWKASSKPAHQRWHEQKQTANCATHIRRARQLLCSARLSLLRQILNLCIAEHDERVRRGALVHIRGRNHKQNLGHTTQHTTMSAQHSARSNAPTYRLALLDGDAVDARHGLQAQARNGLARLLLVAVLLGSTVTSWAISSRQLCKANST